MKKITLQNSIEKEENKKVKLKNKIVIPWNIYWYINRINKQKIKIKFFKQSRISND